MAKQYKVLVNTGKAENNKAIDVQQHAGDKGQPVRIKAQAGTKYQLQELGKDKGKNTAPDYVRAKRNGKNLEITFEDGISPDLIIEDYYDEMPAGYNGVIGQAENGSFYEYIPEDPNPKGLIPELADGVQPTSVALGGTEVSPAGAAVGVLAFPLLAPLGLLGGAAALAAADNSGTTFSTSGGDLSSNSDSGSSNTDGITNVGGISAPTNTEGGGVVQYRVKKDAGAWSSWSSSYTAPATDGTADGAYTVEVQQTDKAGNTSVAQSLSFTLDSTKPNAPLISKIIDDVGVVKSDITATGGRTDDTAPVVRVSLSGTNAVAGDVVELLNDGTLLGASKVKLVAADITTGYVDIAANALSNGTTYNLTARVTDKAGNVGTATATAFAVTIDTTPPTASSYSPVDKSENPAVVDELPPVGSIVITYSENVAKGTGNIVFTPEAGSGAATVTVDVTSSQVVIDGNKVIITPTSGFASLTKYTTSIGSGVITDVAGNAWTGTTVYDFKTTDTNVTVDAVTSDNVINKSENDGGFTITGTIAGTAGVKSSYNTGSFAVKLTSPTLSDVAVTVTNYDSSSGAWTGTVAAGKLVDAKTYTVNVEATAVAGGSLAVGAKSTATKTFTSDLVAAAPDIALTTDSTNGNAGFSSDSITNSGAVSAPTNLEPGATLQYRVKKDAGSFSTWSSSYTAPVADGTVDGVYTVEARQIDAANNTSATTAVSFTLDSTKPNVTNAVLTTDSKNDNLTGGTGTNSDGLTNVGGISAPTNTEGGSVVQYRVKKDAGSFSSWSSSYTAPATDGTADGSYTVEVRQVDKANNAGDVQTITYTLDTTKPATPNVALTRSMPPKRWLKTCIKRGNGIARRG